MRHSILVALVACGGTDELAGTWDSVDNEGELVDGPVQSRWVFEEDGSYRLEHWSVFGTPPIGEEGTWYRVDDNTIQLSAAALTETRVSDDGEFLLVEPQVLRDGKWHIIREHVCGTTGTRGVLEVYEDYTAHEHWECGTRIYDCTGTWVDKPLGITVSWESPTCSRIEYLFRIRDGLGYPGFRRN